MKNKLTVFSIAILSLTLLGCESTTSVGNSSTSIISSITTSSNSSKDGSSSSSSSSIKEEKTLSSISVTHTADKTSYFVGEVFDKTGLVITATYSDTTTKTITDYTIDKTGALTKSDTSITISYQSKTTTLSITVIDDTVSSISVTTDPTKLSYFEGESFDSTGMVVTATYASSKTKSVSDYAIDKTGALTKNDTNILISYQGKTCSLAITVLVDDVTSISITTNPTKMVYSVGDFFDSTGMVVTATYTSEKKKTITDYTYKTTALELTDTDFTITFGELTTILKLTINPSVKEAGLEFKGCLKAWPVSTPVNFSSLEVYQNDGKGTSTLISDYDVYEGDTLLDKTNLKYTDTGLHTLTIKKDTYSKDLSLQIVTPTMEAENIKLSSDAAVGDSYLEKVVAGANDPSTFGVTNAANKAALSSAIGYVGDVKENQVLKFHLYNTEASKKDLLISLASTIYQKTDGSIWHPLEIEEIEANKCFTVKFNDKEVPINSTTLKGKSTSAFTFDIYQNWNLVDLGELDFLSGDNVLELTCISTYHTKAHPVTDTGDARGIGPNIDCLMAL